MRYICYTVPSPNHVFPHQPSLREHPFPRKSVSGRGAAKYQPRMAATGTTRALRFRLGLQLLFNARTYGHIFVP
jgi:hypothetical protein